ncbi:MAG: hypothetical protein OEZ54_03515 [Gemmatimonadota bacterium]|nr:hypothetical protein [Gemmatimonadota bacterium]
MQWPEVVTALATSIIALIALGIAILGLPILRQLVKTATAFERLADTLDREARPLMDATRHAVNETSRVAGKLTDEVDGIVDTSHDLRKRFMRAADSAETRLLEFEALLDVVQDEMEETALDVASALRTTRRGAKVFGSIKKALFGKRSRRRR